MSDSGIVFRETERHPKTARKNFCRGNHTASAFSGDKYTIFFDKVIKDRLGLLSGCIILLRERKKFKFLCLKTKILIKFARVHIMYLQI